MTTSPPPQPPAGWYPDPTGKPGEMYWDGEAWHRLTPDIPATPKANIPGAPKADETRSGNNPAPDILATPKAEIPAKTQVRRWGRVIGNRPLIWNKQLILSLAAVVVIGVLVLVAKPYVLQKLHSPHSGQSHSPSSPSSGSPGSQQSQSPYYQEGYNSGTSGLARKGYGFNMSNSGATVAEMEHQACADAINNESNLASINDPDHPANQDDYMKGCLDAFRDHPPTGKPKPGPLNPYR